MAKADVSITIKPVPQLISRQAECFCSTPANWAEGWVTDSCYVDQISGSVFLEPQWKPVNYPYGLADHLTVPAASAWVESGGALGKGDKGVGFAGSSTVPATTAWQAVLNPTSLTFLKNRGVVISFLWYRPEDDTQPVLKFYPRIDPEHTTTYGGLTVYFSPFLLNIDTQMRMNVYEYPHDGYEQFYANPVTCTQKAMSYPLTVTAEDLASKWHSIWVVPLSDDDVLIMSDILRDGGFIYRSPTDRENIWIMPDGVPAVASTVGGTGQVQMTPLELPASGSIKSKVFSKSSSNTVYPTLKVFGWSPWLAATNRGYMENQLIASDTSGTGGIVYRVYSVVTTDGVETETLVDPAGGTEFQDFKVEIVIAPYLNISPVIQDLMIDFEQDTDTVTADSTDISNDFLTLSGQCADDGNVRFSLRVRNQDGVYDTIADRLMNYVDVDIDGEDFVTLYTMDQDYEWYKTPTEPALEIGWECVDGMAVLQRELVARHPAYDGMLLSDCLTEFMGRLGFDASRLDIDATDGTIGGQEIRLPKKRGKEPYQFKPEDGTPACDFLKKLKEWFGPTHTMRFTGDDIFQFKYIPVDGDGIETPTIARTYYMLSDDKPDPDDHVIYGSPKVNVITSEFYNEIWVVGEDKRNNQPLIALYHNKDSQTNKDDPDYVGRRLLMIVLTKLNRLDALQAVCNRLASFYGWWRIQMQFETRLDPTLQKDDFIKINGLAETWRVTNMDYKVDVGTMADSNINSTTPVIKGMTVTAVQWPVSQ